MPPDRCELDDLLIERAKPYANPPVVTALRGDAVVWSTRLKVSDQADLMPRMENPTIVAGHILAKTDGEHTRGATSHDPRVHLLDRNGRVLWWKPWRLEGPVLSNQGDLVMLVMAAQYHLPVDTAQAWALRVRARDGRPLAMWPLQFSLETMQAFRKSSWPSMSGDLYRKGSSYYALLKASWRGGEDKLKLRLEEPGERPTADQRFKSS